MPERNSAALPAWGAVMLSDGQTRFRLWAPDAAGLDIELDGRRQPMESAADGWFELIAEASPGTGYAFVLPDGTAVPDPAARAQAGDVHARSVVVDPASYRWRTDWTGRPWEQAAILELHVGTFTDEGTFAAAIERLDHLAEAGFTAIEIMPVGQFGGDRGWGYDGVLPYAPHPAYGTPDDLKALVDAAHGRGLMVLLDVVYNHFGPDGNYLGAYASGFYDKSRTTPWGPGIDYRQQPVRRFFIENALYWLEDFRLDGLRLDAVDQIRDPSEPELLVEIAETVRRRITDRPIHLTTEDNRNIVALHERDADGAVPRYTAEWNDDVHNAAHVIATGETEGYYADFAADPSALLARALAEGFAYQGEATVAGEPRGHPSSHLPPTAFVDFLQNHDQTGNRALGERLSVLTDDDMLEALTAVLLLSPHIPLMFMGEEYGETRPFFFFAGFEGDLGRAVTEGRRNEFSGFAAFSDGSAAVPDPVSRKTFERSKLDWDQCAGAAGQAVLQRTRRLLDLRRRFVVPHLAGAGPRSGKVLAAADGAIAVDWHLDGARLELRANLSSSEKNLPQATGDLISDVGTGFGAARSAQHFLFEAGR